MKVSVCIQTYNHAPYIAQALDSVLMQETDFDFEILLGEDESTDGTREICQEYARQHPDKIRLFLNSRENVIYINGRPTGRWNFMNNLRHAQGEYIALLEGDDYWTSPRKLQTQVEFLDQHPDCSMCGHRVRVEDQEGQGAATILPKLSKGFYELKDVVGKRLLRTGAMMLRRGVVQSIPDWFNRHTAADHSVHILAAQHGKIALLDDVMSVYRVHDGGTWSSRSIAERMRLSIAKLQEYDALFDGRFRRRIAPVIASHYLQLARRLLLDGQLSEARAALYNSVRTHLSREHFALRQCKLYVKLVTPGFADQIRRLKSRLRRSPAA